MSTEEPPSSASTTALLDKPLHLLTEDDISQLTREDCRRYLKRKGMRRPSWNKSQAIQQVIMLKALLEPTPDHDACTRKLYITSRQQQTPTSPVQKGTSANTEISVFAEELVPSQRNDPNRSNHPGDNNFVSPGITSVTDAAKGQMTDNSRQHKEDSSIFHGKYSGEGSGSRKALVQRYLEKRKDRFKSKRKACVSLDVYLTHEIVHP